jgi:hypothetical protein
VFHPSTLHLFVGVAYDTVLEKPGKARHNVGKLLSELVRYCGQALIPVLRILDSNFFHPGSALKNLSILKIVSDLSEI